MGVDWVVRQCFARLVGLSSLQSRRVHSLSGDISTSVSGPDSRSADTIFGLSACLLDVVIDFTEDIVRSIYTRPN